MKPEYHLYLTQTVAADTAMLYKAAFEFIERHIAPDVYVVFDNVYPARFDVGNDFVIQTLQSVILDHFERAFNSIGIIVSKDTPVFTTTHIETLYKILESLYTLDPVGHAPVIERCLSVAEDKEQFIVMLIKELTDIEFTAVDNFSTACLVNLQNVLIDVGTLDAEIIEETGVNDRVNAYIHRYMQTYPDDPVGPMFLGTKWGSDDITRYISIFYKYLVPADAGLSTSPVHLDRWAIIATGSLDDQVRLKIERVLNTFCEQSEVYDSMIAINKRLRG